MIPSDRLLLSPMELEHVRDPRYLGWLSDPEVTRYLEVGIRATPDPDVEGYWYECRERQDLFLRIVVREPSSWIGTIRLGDITWVHRRGELGIMIGEAGEWGKGYGREAIDVLAQHAFDRMGLHKVTAGVIELNVGAQRAFAEAGFEREAVLSEHRWCLGHWCSEYRYARYAPCG